MEYGKIRDQSDAQEAPKDTDKPHLHIVLETGKKVSYPALNRAFGRQTRPHSEHIRDSIKANLVYILKGLRPDLGSKLGRKEYLNNVGFDDILAELKQAAADHPNQFGVYGQLTDLEFGLKRSRFAQQMSEFRPPSKSVDQLMELGLIKCVADYNFYSRLQSDAQWNRQAPAPPPAKTSPPKTASWQPKTSDIGF